LYFGFTFVQGLAQKKYVLLQYPQSYTNLRIPSGPTKDSVGVTSSCMPCFSFFSQPISARPTVAASLCLCTGKGERREGEDGSEDLGLAARWNRHAHSSPTRTTTRQMEKKKKGVDH
jgi:hypothetical protein